MASSSSSTPFPSKPLHNFELPSLKWNKEPKPTNRRRSAKSPTPILESSKIPSADHLSLSPLPKNTNKTTNKPSEKQDSPAITKPPASSKIVLKLPCKIKNDDEKTVQKSNEKDEMNEDNKVENEEDEDAKIWNLRPRRPLVRGKCGRNVGDVKDSNNKGKNQVMIGDNEEGKKDKEKVADRVDVALSREEIEEDMFAFTGLKTMRRPKKRHRNVQKRLDYMFPGLGLVSITPETYKVTDNSTKG